MADIFLDIRDRQIRVIVSDHDEVQFQRVYALNADEKFHRPQHEQSVDRQSLQEGGLIDLVSTIRNDSGANFDTAHLIVASTDVQREVHRLPRMTTLDAITLLTRKIAEKNSDESPQISATPMAAEENYQEWLVEYIPSTTLRGYKNAFAAAKIKLKTVTTALDATIHAISDIRESIFNAHAVFEINATSIEAYFVSNSSILLHETLTFTNDDDFNATLETDRSQKRRVFTILDMLYRTNSQYQTIHPMTPLQKVWLCGTEPNISDLSVTLQDAMDVETALLSNEDDCALVVLNGFVNAYKSGLATNFMSPDLLRRFPLRKKTGILVYILTALLAVFFISTTEYQHYKLKLKATIEKKNLSALKTSQATSASFAKNLELLKKLSGSQLVFYPLLKELAMNLPDNVNLDSFVYINKDDIDTLELTASFSRSSDLGAQKTLTRLMNAMNESPYLKHYREPTITSVNKDLNKTMTVKFTCEVRQLDASK